MKKIAIMLFSLILLIGPFQLTIDVIDSKVVIMTNTRGFENFTMDMDVAMASIASFIGTEDDMVGDPISDAGDVNGDGYDDILIGVSQDDEGGYRAGQTYLVLGKASGWSMNTDLGSADASFIGEAEEDYSGYWTSGAGDVNGDGFDDILISALGSDAGGGDAGQTYLFLGKATGWSMDTDLGSADASFNGEANEDYSGNAVAGVGDVNGDGFDDFIIGVRDNDEGGYGAGQTYLIFGKTTGWQMHTDLSNADASYIGEEMSDKSGFPISGAGDVNGDGYDDILIGAHQNDEGGNNAGQTYLILGKDTGWLMDTDLGSVDASFIGATAGDRSGFSVSNAGDVNGDGYDDILIGAPNNNGGSEYAGQTYLIWGNASGWAMDINISNSDASFVGETSGDYSGGWISEAGDVNGDGFGDILIGAGSNDEGGNDAGQTYLILGKSMGWLMGMNLSSSDASFIGEKRNDKSGFLISGAGDVNGDGIDDFLIGAKMNDEGGNSAGQVYLLSGYRNKEPTKVYSLETYYKPYQVPKRTFNIGNTIYIELIGEDGNSSQQDSATINISYEVSPVKIGRIYLRETGLNTGIYRGWFVVPLNMKYLDTIIFEPRSDPSFKIEVFIDKTNRPNSVNELKLFSDDSYNEEWEYFDKSDHVYIQVVGADADPSTTNHAFINSTIPGNQTFKIIAMLEETGDNTGIYRGSYQVPDYLEYLLEITVYSCRNHQIITNYTVETPLILQPELDKMKVQEDEYFSVKFYNDGYADETCDAEFDGEWLNWDENEQIINGTPDNNHIGKWEVYLSITDGRGHIDEMTFQIIVNNTPPSITTQPITEIEEGEVYFCDFNSTDDGQGDITWSLIGANTWMFIDETTGWLTGLPSNEEVGIHNISVNVNDGNGGVNSTEFQLTVIDLNMKPIILTTDITTGIEGERYYRDYEAHDPDNTVDLIWELLTDANFLTLDPETGVLEGTPGPYDVGEWNVNVTVKDQGGLMDSHNFILIIENVNDRPKWMEVPNDIAIKHGEQYIFDVNASDLDPLTILEFSINSIPASDILIDPETGIIEWIASVHWFDNEPCDLKVTITVSDGEFSEIHSFTITVIPSGPPTSSISGPDDQQRTPSSNTQLIWTGTDPENEPIVYDVYLHQTEAFVIGYREEALHSKDLDTNQLNITGLESGMTYYWTVRPYDGCSFGACTSGIQSFRVNYRPSFRNIEDHQVPTGTNFKYKISCTDEDTEDLPNLRYSLIEPPEGMTISEETGMIRWTPDNDQVMLHIVTVGVSDGIEMNTATFEIEVTEGESTASTLIITIAIAVIIILLIALGIFFFIRKKREMDDEALKREEEERASLEKEREEEYSSYEELYGIPAPEKDEEELTTRELKDYIHEKIEELEG